MTRRALAALIAAVMLLVGAPTTAHASTSWVDISGPTVFKHNQEITFTLDLHIDKNAWTHDGDKGVEVEGWLFGGPKDRTVWQWGSEVVASSKTVAVTVAPQAPGTYWLTIMGNGDVGQDGFEETRKITVALPLTFSKVSVAPSTFYPFKKDGYRDVTKMTYRPSHEARIVARVRNGKGKLVRTVKVGLRRPARHTFTWNGKAGGKLVKPGKYRIHITGTPTNGGVGRSVSREVVVKRG
jgi:hypothetical protein